MVDLFHGDLSSYELLDIRQRHGVVFAAEADGVP